MLDVDKHRNERYGFPQTKKEEKHMFLHEIYSSTLFVKKKHLTPGSISCMITQVNEKRISHSGRRDTRSYGI